MRGSLKYRGFSGGAVLRSLGLGLGLLVLALTALIALNPQFDRFRGLVDPSARQVSESVFLSSQSRLKQEKRVGAEANSVADTTPVAESAGAAVPPASAEDSRYAFLLMGYGGGSHDGAYLTDSMMVVIVDTTHKSLTLLSIPRDAWVPMTFNGQTTIYNKINTAYAFAQDPTLYPDRLDRYKGAQGPGTFAMDTVSRLLGIPIKYYLSLDFQGFREMINAVGGIDVEVPVSFAARYPANDDPSVDPSWITIRFTKGLQHMDGERAIEYARARETIDDSNEGSDFARSRRQRLIIQAFKNRLFEAGGLIHLPQLLAIAASHVDTNYAIPDVARLSRMAADWKDVTIYQTALTSANYLEQATGPDGTFIVVPSTPDHSWTQIRAFARRLWTDPQVGIGLAATTVIVENDTNVPGLAGRVTDALLRLGYNVGDPISGPRRQQTGVVDRSGGKAAPVIRQLETDLGQGDLEVEDPPADDNSTVVLQLGADATSWSLPSPIDATAPFSTVGVIKFGVWPYLPPQPTPPTTTSRATPTPARGASRPTATPTPKSSERVIVPDLIGLPEAEAQRLIAEAGLGTTYVNFQTINDVADRSYFLSIPPGDVLSQSPRPGTEVPRGTRVYLAVRKR